MKTAGLKNRGPGPLAWGKRGRGRPWIPKGPRCVKQKPAYRKGEDWGKGLRKGTQDRPADKVKRVTSGGKRARRDKTSFQNGRNRDLQKEG